MNIDTTFNLKFIELEELNEPRFLFYAITGGRGSGKSYSIAQALLEVGYKYKKRIFCMREVQSTIEQSSYEELKSKIDDVYKYFGWCYNKCSMWNTHTGSTIVFKGMLDRNTSSRESLKGYSGVDIFWIDEAQVITKATLDVFIPLMRKEFGCAIFSFNKISNNLPVWEALHLDNPDKHTFFLEINYPDNPFINQTFIDIALKLKEIKPDEYDQYYMNIPNDQHKNLVVKHFTSDNVRKINYQKDLPIHISCDFNVGVMSWILAHKTTDKIFYFDELLVENTTTEDCIKLLIERYKDHKGGFVVNGDASGDYRKTQSKQTDYVQIKNALTKAYPNQNVFIEIRRFNPPIEARVKAFNAKVLTDAGVRCLYFDPKCKWTLHNIYNLKYDITGKNIETFTKQQLENAKELKYLGHIYDAMSYIVEYYYPIKKEYNNG